MNQLVSARISGTRQLSLDKPISIAVVAMGGQGGGVLSDWIVSLAEAQGWAAQSTSVPGLAQRTGATLYYIEMLAPSDGRIPIFALMPTPGDVDAVIASELMEAGRSMLRGLVTPDRTTLIASTHRSFAISEKSTPTGAVGDPAIVVDAANFAARRTIAFDMDAFATQNGSVISASLFGALAASGVLPFTLDQFLDTIRAGGKGVEPSVRTATAAYERVMSGNKAPVAAALEKPAALPEQRPVHAALRSLKEQVARDFPAEAQQMLLAGVHKLTDYQDIAYAQEYLDRVARTLEADRRHGGPTSNFAFTVEAAKYIAVAMSYDDVIRVADLKVKRSRFERVRREVGARADQIVYTTEFMHPRMEEVCGALPRGFGLWIERHERLFQLLDKFVSKGRRVRTGTVCWFIALYIVSSTRRIRRRTLRHWREVEHLNSWLAVATALLATNYDLAVEVVKCRRLVKGYSDTHSRGMTKFEKVLSAVPMLEHRSDGAVWLARLRQAALADEDGVMLDGALKTIATF